MNARKYIRQVDKEMEQLHAHKLGQDIPFEQIWPPQLDKERRKEWLADRLLFELAELSPGADKSDLDKGWEWLYGMICFLCEHCNEEDRNFRSLFTLKKQAREIRQSMFPLYIDTLEIYRAIRNDLQSPKVLDMLEEAVVNVTGVANYGNT